MCIVHSRSSPKPRAFVHRQVHPPIVLEMLISGDIFIHLRRRLGLFEEAHTQYYAATVLFSPSSTCTMSASPTTTSNPENLVLDDKTNKCPALQCF